MSMIREAEARGLIKPGDTIIEATSGNTGIALAMAAAIRGYRLILIMPSHMSSERKLSMAAYGAELIEVTQSEGMEGARDLAAQMAAAGEGIVLDQFANPDNPLGHVSSTGPEIWSRPMARSHTSSVQWAPRGRSWECPHFSRPKIQRFKLSDYSPLRDPRFRNSALA